KGGDLEYSMKFAPAYTSLYQALHGMGQFINSGGIGSLMARPALEVLSFVHFEFASIERSIGRTRELDADRAGASVTDSTALVTALFKVSEFSGRWPELWQDDADALSKGGPPKDLSEAFVTASKSVYAEMDFAANREKLLNSVASHPTDTHPT